MKKKSLGVIISEDIKKEIISGKYQAGDKLPTERELAEYYKVSRVPVREAISLLTQEDIVSVKRSSGIFVTNVPPSFISVSYTHLFLCSLSIHRIFQSPFRPAQRPSGSPEESLPSPRTRFPG